MRSGLVALARRQAGRHAAQRGRAGRGDVGLAARVETRLEDVGRVLSAESTCKMHGILQINTPL